MMVKTMMTRLKMSLCYQVQGQRHFESITCISQVCPYMYICARQANCSTGNICDENSIDLPPGTLPTPRTDKGPDNWSPYKSRIRFKLADFLYHHNQMSGGDIDILLNLIAATLTRHNDQLLFRNHKEMYETIDVTTHGGAPWKSFAL